MSLVEGIPHVGVAYAELPVQHGVVTPDESSSGCSRLSPLSICEQSSPKHEEIHFHHQHNDIPVFNSKSTAPGAALEWDHAPVSVTHGSSETVPDTTPHRRASIANQDKMPGGAEAGINRFHHALNDEMHADTYRSLTPNMFGHAGVSGGAGQMPISPSDDTLAERMEGVFVSESARGSIDMELHPDKVFGVISAQSNVTLPSTAQPSPPSVFRSRKASSTDPHMGLPPPSAEAHEMSFPTPDEQHWSDPHFEFPAGWMPEIPVRVSSADQYLILGGAGPMPALESFTHTLAPTRASSSATPPRGLKMSSGPDFSLIEPDQMPTMLTQQPPARRSTRSTAGKSTIFSQMFCFNPRTDVTADDDDDEDMTGNDGSDDSMLDYERNMPERELPLDESDIEEADDMYPSQQRRRNRRSSLSSTEHEPTAKRARVGGEGASVRASHRDNGGGRTSNRGLRSDNERRVCLALFSNVVSDPARACGSLGSSSASSSRHKPKFTPKASPSTPTVIIATTQGSPTQNCLHIGPTEIPIYGASPAPLSATAVSEPVRRSARAAALKPAEIATTTTTATTTTAAPVTAGEPVQMSEDPEFPADAYSPTSKDGVGSCFSREIGEKDGLLPVVVTAAGKKRGRPRKYPEGYDAQGNKIEPTIRKGIYRITYKTQVQVWRVTVYWQGRNHYLGTFSSELAAARAHDRGIFQYYCSDPAALNTINDHLITPIPGLDVTRPINEQLDRLPKYFFAEDDPEPIPAATGAGACCVGSRA